MSDNQSSAAQRHGQAKDKTEQAGELAKSTGQSKHDRICDEASRQAQTQQLRNREEGTGILQQTEEQVTQMAQGAVDGVKNTLGK